MPMNVKWSGTKVPSPKSPMNRVQYKVNIGAFLNTSIPVEKLFIESEVNSQKSIRRPLVFVVSNDIPITSDETKTLTN